MASVPQLRKLRETADDDMVNGKEYARRLRKQYERLYPMPDWAVHATGMANKKRRRTIEDDESGDESASDMDVDEEDLSTQPLAKLLKDADILSRASRGTAKRRKLQAGTISMHRFKDVARDGPVSDARLLAEVSRLTIMAVCYYFSVFSSCIPATTLLRSQLNAVSSPCQPEPAKPEPSPHITTHQAHSSCHDLFPSLSVRFAHLSQCSTPLLPRLGYRDR